MMNFLADKIFAAQTLIEKNASINERKILLSELNNIATLMYNLNINSEKDYKDFFYIISNINNITKNIIKKQLNKEDISKVSEEVYKNREVLPIDSYNNFLKAVKSVLRDNMIKIAYPSGYDTNYIQSPYNISKWIESMKKIYALKTRGTGYREALDSITKDWDIMEKRNFEHWLRFYQAGSQFAYKTAQMRYYDPSGDSAGLIPFSAIQNKELEQEQEKQKNTEIANKINKLIGRLNSAEKIFTSTDFKRILGDEYNTWISYLHELKRIIYSKQPKYALLIKDLIIKQGNKLRNEGCYKSGRLMDILGEYQYQLMTELDRLEKHAQVAPPPVGGEADLLGGTEEPLGGDIAPNDGRDLSDPEGAMNQFIKNLGGDIKEDKEENIDKDAFIIIEEDELYKTAQLSKNELLGNPEEDKTPLQQPLLQAPKPTKEIPLPEEHKSEEGDPDKGDNAIDVALKNISINDTIAKIEEVVQFYRNRQISRELLVIDLMLEALGVAAFFPSMAEAAKSALDSNQYVLTRLEDILAKLRGATATEDGSLDALHNKLDQQVKNKEKKQEQKAIESMNPMVETPKTPLPPPAPIQKELTEPIKIEKKPQPAPIR